MDTNQNKSSFHRAAPSYMNAAVQWVDSLTYPEITEQIVMYNAYLKTYEDSYANIIGFLPLMLTVLQVIYSNNTDYILSESTVMTLLIITFIAAPIIFVYAWLKRNVNLGYIAITIPILIGVQYLLESSSILVLLSFIMITGYFWTIAHYKPQDMKNYIILELLQQRKSLIESSNPASEIRMPKKYKQYK